MSQQLQQVRYVISFKHTYQCEYEYTSVTACKTEIENCRTMLAVGSLLKVDEDAAKKNVYEQTEQKQK